MTALAAAAVVLALITASGRAASARSRLSRSDPAPLAARRSAGAVVVVVAVVAVVVASPLAGAATVVTGLAGWRLLRHRRREQERRACDADVVTLTFAVAAELRAGRPPGAALEAVAPHLRVLGTAVGRAARHVGAGADVDHELHAIEARWHCSRLAPVRAAWTATMASGAGVADVLDRIGESFDADDRAAGELAAAAAGPRATIAVLTLLPAFGLVLGGGLGLAPWHVLLHTRAGAALGAGAAVLDTLGLLWVRRIMTGALRS